MANYDQNKKPYSWMPDFLRRFLNLEYDDEPSANARSAPAGYASAPTTLARPESPWSPPSEPTFKASSMEAYMPPASSGFTPPSAPAPRPTVSDADTGSSVAPAQGQVDILSIAGALRGFVRGTLPPQGIEAFAKEVLTTANSVWDMYSRWIGFQTGDVVKAGWGVVKAIGGLIPTGSAPAAPARRIKVMIANGDQEATAIKVEP